MEGPGKLFLCILRQLISRLHDDDVYQIIMSSLQSIRVVSEYYTRIRTSRLSELLKIPEQVCSVMSTEFVQISKIYLKDEEDFVSRLVTKRSYMPRLPKPDIIVG